MASIRTLYEKKGYYETRITRFDGCLTPYGLNTKSIFSKTFGDEPCFQLKECYAILDPKLKTKAQCDQELVDNLTAKCEGKTLFKMLCKREAKRWGELMKNEGNDMWVEFSKYRGPVLLKFDDYDCINTDPNDDVLLGNENCYYVNAGFYPIRTAPGVYAFKSANIQSCINAFVDDELNAKECDFGPNQQFRILNAADEGFYTLESVAFSDKCIDEDILSDCSEDEDYQTFSLIYVNGWDVYYPLRQDYQPLK